jgi:SAM-dependent methyltransferase
MALIRLPTSLNSHKARPESRAHYASEGFWDRLCAYLDTRQSPLILMLRSLRTRGLIRTLNRVIIIVADIGFDLRYGTDTMRRIFNLNSLRINGEQKEGGCGYQATEAMTLRKLMRKIDFPKNGVFVDLGSGKGRVLLLAAQCGFLRIVGVEFSPELCEIARQNIKLFKRKTGNEAQIEVIQADVASVAIEPEVNVLFMYNPFDKIKMRQFLSAVRHSLTQFPRKIWLIYNNPIQAESVQKSELFCSIQEFRINENTFEVYHN